MTYPTRHEIDLMVAFLGGYLEEGDCKVVTLPDAIAIMRRPVAATVQVDGMIASRILRRCGFARSYLPADADVITYRRTA